jgi:4-hydroxy-tetrahydrodipicolinate synthase
VPSRVQALCDAFLSDRFAEAQETHRGIFPLAKGLLSLDVNPVPLKAAMRLLGRDSGAVRLPLAEALKETAARIGEILAAAGLLKLEAVAVETKQASQPQTVRA